MKVSKLPLFSIFLIAILVASSFISTSLFPVEVAHAASCPVTDGDGGDGDAVVGQYTMNGGGTVTWAPTDATAFDCSTLSFIITNNTTLTINQNPANGYIGQINAIDMTIDSGSYLNANGEGCRPNYDGQAAQSYGPNTSTNVCEVGGAGIGSNPTSTGTSKAGGGAGHCGAGGNGSGPISGGSSYDSESNPVLFGAAGGSANWYGPYDWGGYGGGVIKLNLSGTLDNDGTIQSNGWDSCPSGCSGYRGGGGGSGGSINITAATLEGGGNINANVWRWR